MCERNERNALAPQAILEAAMAPWEGKALQRAETAAERFGLRLSPEAYERLGEERRRALRETRRLELGEGILPALMLAPRISVRTAGRRAWGNSRAFSTSSKTRPGTLCRTPSSSPPWPGYSKPRAGA